ncbi:MAG: hypothetical protein QF473_13400 [Planctomycetota bacterium]|nr:hypothetical protein [Planctomycetota bacterium]
MAADETANNLRGQTASVRKIRQQASAMDREVQAIRELMEASGVISEESLLAVKRISTEIDSAANQSLNKALVHIAEARDNIADAAPHVALAIREQDAAEKSLKNAHREATIQAQVSLLMDRLTRLSEDLVTLQEETRESHDSTLAGNAVDSDAIAEKQHRLADRFDPAQEALTFLREAGEMPEAEPEDAGKKLDSAAHAIARDLEDEQYTKAITGQTNLLAWIDRIVNQLEEKQPQQQAMQEMIQQIEEQNQDIQEFQEEQQQEQAQDDQQQQLQEQQQQLQEQQQQLSQQLQKMNQQQAQAESEKAQAEMEKGNLPKAQEQNEKAREMLQQTMAEMRAMQNVIEQVKEQNQDLQNFQEQGQQPSAENEEFNELQAQQQELAQDIQATNQPQAQAEAEKAQMEMEAGNMSKAQEHNEKVGELLQQAMAAAMGQEEMTAEKKDMPAPGAGEEKTEERTELAGGGPGEETKEEVDLPNFQTNELDIGEVSTGDGWTRELGESEKTSIRQGAQTEGPKAYKSLADQYFEAIGTN